jgi:hypothetical protein
MTPKPCASKRGLITRAELGPLVGAYYASVASAPLPSHLSELAERFAEMVEQHGAAESERPSPRQ